MKFRAPSSHEHVHIGLTSGHTFVVHREPTDVPPMFIEQAMKRGCIPCDAEIPVLTKVVRPTSNEDVIVEAIKRMLEANVPGTFMADGRPQIDALAKVVGFTITTGQRDSAWAATKALVA